MEDMGDALAEKLVRSEKSECTKKSPNIRTFQNN